MSRYTAWVAIGVAAAFLVVATAAFSLGAVEWLAFSIAVGTLIVSACLAYADRAHAASLYTALVIVVISAWTIVASLVFSLSTVQSLALASALATAGLALVGLTEHEFSQVRAAQSGTETSGEGETRLAAAA